MKKISYILLLFFLLIFFTSAFFKSDSTVTWELKNIHCIGGLKTEILGNPLIETDGKDTSIDFNGIDDGLIVPDIPIKGWSVFTIEVLFKPDGDGPIAPRFIHFEDTAFRRGTFEIRLTNKKQWYLDAFLKNGKTDRGLALIDSTKLHPADQWFWVAMEYDGKKMISFVNGKKELEGKFNFSAMTKGNISLGVRLNKVDWFKGQIKEIRFHPEALKSQGLQHF
jgi:hypothetical protein